MAILQHWPSSVFIAVLLILLAAGLMRLKSAGAEQWPFQKKHLLSAPEQTAYWRLLKAAPGLIVLAQVAMSSFVEVKRGTPSRVRYRNRIAQKYVDLVLCRKDGSVLAVIEIDDASHTRTRRVEDDRIKDKIMEAAGIPILRWKATRLPNEESMRADIAALTDSSLRVAPDDARSRG